MDAECAGLLVLPDTYFPGWSATVNGRERQVLATDGAFRGVLVPRGASTVEFHYEPSQFPLGVGLAVSGIAVFGIVVLVTVVRRRHAPTTDVAMRPSSRRRDSDESRRNGPADRDAGRPTAMLRRMVVAVQPLDRASLCALLARYLVGDGVELGPGHSPFPIPYSGTNVRYVDRWVPDTNRELFPELGEAAFPMPDIIADLDTDRLSALDDESQDFVIASHVLEHLANPLAMLGEIHRVLRSGGIALVLLPDRRRTFDQRSAPDSGAAPRGGVRGRCDHGDR